MRTKIFSPSRAIAGLAGFLALFSTQGAAMPSPTDVLSEGERLNDRRVAEIKTHNTPWEFQKPASREEWSAKRDRIRRKILISCGLWPMGEKGPLKVEVFEKKEHEDYTVEKVLLQTFPGYYATGNLYRPKQSADQPAHTYPGILCPHGHWPKGRFNDDEKASVPARAIHFARQGYVCFTYDMVGYGDNGVFLGHNFGGPREEIWGISPAGFQLYTSIRALDFLQSLPDVDPNKIACTGASGGGTQTFLLGAVDDRVKVAAPVNMISAHMQGGCACENPPGLRLDINNMDIGAMMAPRPLLLVCATGDWTKNTPTVEFPAIKSVYDLLDRGERVKMHQVDAPHNYNKESREAVYQAFAKAFYRDRPTSDFAEGEYAVDATEDLQVFARHPVPEDKLDAEPLFAALRESRAKALSEYTKEHPSAAEQVFAAAYREVLAVREPNLEDVQVDKLSKEEKKGFTRERFILADNKTGQRVPASLYLPKRIDAKRKFGGVVLIHPGGKAGLVDPSDAPGPELKAYLEAGLPTLAIDCLGTGEYVNDASWTERVKASHPGGTAHFATYNLTEVQGRVQDILLAETWLGNRFKKPAEIVGLPGAGGWTLLAHGLATRASGTQSDLSGLDFTDDKAFVESLFIPNLRQVGDFVTSILIAGKRPAEWTGCADEAFEKILEEAKARAGGS